MKTDKYKVNQKLMNKINNWRDGVDLLVMDQDLMVGDELPYNVYAWWMDSNVSDKESNNRLIALIRYINGEDVFEVEKPEKWIVRSKHQLNRQFLGLIDWRGDEPKLPMYAYEISLTRIEDDAFKFNSKEEAEQYSNPLMEVVEVEND